MPGAGVELHWIPLGTGQIVVRASGRLFEAGSAVLGRRPRCHLYHSALVVTGPAGRVVVEVAPVPDGDGPSRGAVASGPVGVAWLGRFRWFRYEVRCWPDGDIPDLHAAVVTHRPPIDDGTAERILALAAEVPTPVWGRDHERVGEMWNSNSVTAWLLTRAGLDTVPLGPPPGGRAPGWDAGRIVAARSGPTAPAP